MSGKVPLSTVQWQFASRWAARRLQIFIVSSLFFQRSNWAQRRARSPLFLRVVYKTSCDHEVSFCHFELLIRCVIVHQQKFIRSFGFVNGELALISCRRRQGTKLSSAVAARSYYYTTHTCPLVFSGHLSLLFVFYDLNAQLSLVFHYYYIFFILVAFKVIVLKLIYYIIHAYIGKYYSMCDYCYYRYYITYCFIF